VGGKDDWAQPGAFEVADGVFRIPLPLPGDGLKAVNVYAVRDGERVVLVDGGWALPDSEELLARSLDKIGYGLDGIDRFLVTHAHRDHYTQAAAVRRRFGTRIALGVAEQASLDELHPDAERPAPAQLALLTLAGAQDVRTALERLWTRGDFDRRDWLPPDDWLADGTDVPVFGRTLRAVHTPGHTRGHLVFHDESGGLLFSGDHVLPHITPSIGFEQATVRLPLLDYLTSLELVRRMPDAVMLPAHGPAGARVHQRVDELLAHHEQRLDLAEAALRAGADTSREVAALLSWTSRHRHFDDLDVFNQMLAVLEAAAHLDLLAERGRLTRQVLDGVAHYAPG
jgi:glyoxylase-like metal-dependent hydrolase (beta-lactamase superfamily II)